MNLNSAAVDPNPLFFAFEVSDADKILKPGSPFAYTASVSNLLQPGAFGRSGQIYASGDVSFTLPSRITLANGDTQTTFAQPRVLAGNGVSQSLALKIKDDAPTSLANLLGIADAQLYEGGCCPTTGLIGPLSNGGSLTLTIDNDLPTAQAAGPQYIQPGQTLVFGGTVSDPTSYLTRAQVSVDNGAWNDAGLDAPVSTAGGSQGWAFAWTAPNVDGDHSSACAPPMQWIGREIRPHPIRYRWTA